MSIGPDMSLVMTGPVAYRHGMFSNASQHLPLYTTGIIATLRSSNMAFWMVAKAAGLVSSLVYAPPKPSFKEPKLIQ